MKMKWILFSTLSLLIFFIFWSFISINTNEEVKAKDSQVNVVEFSHLKEKIKEGNDWTKAFNAANKSLPNGGTIEVPAGVYYIKATGLKGDQSERDKPTGGVSLGNNIDLKLSANATIKAIPNDSESYAIIRIADKSNVKISGKGTIQGDRNEHIGEEGEWGYCIAINGAMNVTIEDVNIVDCWGDGIFIGAGLERKDNPTSNVKIIRVNADNNRRQGISIIHANKVVIENSKFVNTNGTPPSSGIDIEPEVVVDYSVKNVLIKDSYFYNNNGFGIQVNERVEDVEIEGNTCSKNKGSGMVFYKSKDVLVRGNICENNLGNGITIDNSSEVTLNANELNNNQSGISIIGGAKNNMLISNAIKNNNKNGIELIGAHSNKIKSNTFLLNKEKSIYLYSASHNLLYNNICNDDKGILIEGESRDNILKNNKCS